ncbi:hypothetical protein V8B55DRAFT_1560760 [Mucor lusitanicus]|uniref:F-box domain-containing protein n=2 Tax=Mucor circinelloides f. lusitanicus TaxID=29924 RepID=A0A168PNA7_MUCCL|nr:hypothetical protein MUCCIDRAFT_104920 [Mucor lusitanicus CBS 277.49]
MLTIDTFPDEIIIQVLSQRTMDLRTLATVMAVSARLRRLVIHVLAMYRLPDLQLALTVEQEGKSRITTSYEFGRFNSTSLTVVMVAHQPKARRYYTSKASPVVRSMALLPTTNDTPTTAMPNLYYPSSAKKLSAKKEGIHILQASAWKLAYRITSIQKPEYYLTPVSIAIDFAHLITLESVHCPAKYRSSNSSMIKLNKAKRWAAGLFST